MRLHFIKYLVLAVLIIGSLTFTSMANAEIKIYEGIGSYYIEDENEKLDKSKEKAKTLAELDAMEQAQVNIESYSMANNYQLTKDEIISITAGIMNVTEVKYYIDCNSGESTLVKAVLTAEIDTDKIQEYVELEMKRRTNKK